MYATWITFPPLSSFLPPPTPQLILYLAGHLRTLDPTRNIGLAELAVLNVIPTWLDWMLSSNWPSSPRTEQLLITIDSSLISFSDFPLSLLLDIEIACYPLFFSTLSALTMHNDIPSLMLWFPRRLLFACVLWHCAWLSSFHGFLDSGYGVFGLTFLLFPSRMAGLGHAVFTWLAIALICSLMQTRDEMIPWQILFKFTFSFIQHYIPLQLFSLSFIN